MTVELVAEEDNDVAIGHVREMHGEAVVGGYNSADCKHHIGYFGRVNAVDRRPWSEPGAERGAG